MLILNYRDVDMLIPTQWTFLAFFVIFELGSVLCGAAQSSAMLIVGRAVAGIGASGLNNGAVTIVSSAVSIQRRPGKLLLTRICETKVRS